MKYTPQHIRRALLARQKGAGYIVSIIQACVKYDVPLAAGFALIKKETGFRNVWGHDAAWKQGSLAAGHRYSGGTDDASGKSVTKSRYLKYRAARYLYGYQGVGPARLNLGSNAGFS